MWKSVERFPEHPVTHTWPVNSIREAVDCFTLLGPCVLFTSFLIMNVVEKSLNSIKTIANLVEKSIQISVRLAQLRNLVYRVQNSCVMFAAELPANLG